MITAHDYSLGLVVTEAVHGGRAKFGLADLASDQVGVERIETRRYGSREGF
jgi:hypothetical protein